MKKISSNQSKVFDKKNALRAFGDVPKFAEGGPVLGKTRAAADAAIDAEATRGLPMATPVASITAPPPAAPPAQPSLMTRAGIGMTDALASVFPIGNPLKKQESMALKGFAHGGSVYQTEPTAATPAYPVPGAARGGPSPMRLGAAGVPGVPPAFDVGGAIPPNSGMNIGLDSPDFWEKHLESGGTPPFVSTPGYEAASRRHMEKMFSTLSSSSRPPSGAAPMPAPMAAPMPAAPPRMVSAGMRDARLDAAGQNTSSLRRYANGGQPLLQVPDPPSNTRNLVGKRRPENITPHPVDLVKNALRSSTPNSGVIPLEELSPLKAVKHTYEEGGPVTEHHPEKQGKDEQVVLAAAGEYILPKKTVDALGGPDALDQIVQSTNDGKEPNNSNSQSTLRASQGMSMVPFDPVYGQRPGTGRTGSYDREVRARAEQMRTKQAQRIQAQWAAEDAAKGPRAEPVKAADPAKTMRQKVVDGAKSAGSKVSSALKPTPTAWYQPSTLPAKAVVGAGKFAAKVGAPGYLAASALETGRTPTEQYEKRFGLGSNQYDGVAGLLRDLAVRAAGAGSDLVNPGNILGYADKADAAKPPQQPVPAQTWADGDRIDMATNTFDPVLNAPQARPAPQYGALRNKFDGVNFGPGGIYSFSGASKNLGQLAANAGENAATRGNNKQLMAEQLMNWDQQKFGLQRQWDMQKYGFDYAKDMNKENMLRLHEQVDKMYPIADKDGNVIKDNVQLNQYAKGTLDNTAGAAGGYHKFTPGDSNEALVQTTRAANELQNRAGVTGAIKSAWHGGDFRMPRTVADMVPNAPSQVGVIGTTIPTAAGPVSANTARGNSNVLLPGAPPRMQDVENLKRAERGYKTGGRIMKSKLRSGGC